MAGNKNSGGGPKFRMTEADFKTQVAKYMKDTEDGAMVRPSLPDFCVRYLRTYEERLLEWLSYGDNPDGAYYGRVEELKFFLAWLRSQMISSGRYDGATGKKFAEMQLDKDHGDGVSYSAQDDRNARPPQIVVRFGGDDPRAKKAMK